MKQQEKCEERKGVKTTGERRDALRSVRSSEPSGEDDQLVLNDKGLNCHACGVKELQNLNSHHFKIKISRACLCQCEVT